MRGRIFCIIVFLVLFSGLCAASEKEYEIALTKGIYAIETGDYREALEYLAVALDAKPGDRVALLASGIAHSRAGDLEEARDILEGVIEQDPANGRAWYELGIVLQKLGQRDAAVECFAEAGRTGSEESVRKAALSYIALAAGGREKERSYSLGLLLGMQYDTNTTVEPSNPALDRGDEEDFRTIILLDALWSPMRRGGMELETGYRYYRSFHSENSDFDLGQHTLYLKAGYGSGKAAGLDIQYRLAYTDAGGDLYASIHDIMLDAGVEYGEGMETGINYAHGFRKYFDSRPFRDNSLRSGGSDSVAVRQKAEIKGMASLALEYAYEWTSAEAGFWEYAAHRGVLGGDVRGRRWRLGAEVSYEDRRYDEPFPVLNERRHDRVQEYSLNFSWVLTRHVRLGISELFVINASNLERFDYDRSITGLYLTGRLGQ